jgi:hypothetical protein
MPIIAKELLITEALIAREYEEFPAIVCVPQTIPSARQRYIENYFC